MVVHLHLLGVDSVDNKPFLQKWHGGGTDGRGFRSTRVTRVEVTGLQPVDYPSCLCSTPCRSCPGGPGWRGDGPDIRVFPSALGSNAA